MGIAPRGRVLFFFGTITQNATVEALCCVDCGPKTAFRFQYQLFRLPKTWLDNLKGADAQRFADGKALASYVGMIPREYSSGERQRFGGLTKQGSPLLRFLWGEAAAHAARRDPESQRFYRHKLVQKGLGKVRMAVARKSDIRLWIMLRDQID
jgi:Transposase IS116/IS110/IS902 family